jgi:hypothetical protein
MFKFNGNYKDLAQVELFYDDYKHVLDTLDGFAYNYCFTGRIAGLAGEEDEGKGIYLLQQLHTEKERQAKIKQLIADGYTQVHSEEGGSVKYASIVKVGNNNSRSGFDEYPKARIFFAEGRMFIVPKGNRTRGYNVWPDSVVYAKGKVAV